MQSCRGASPSLGEPGHCPNRVGCPSFCLWILTFAPCVRGTWAIPHYRSLDCVLFCEYSLQLYLPRLKEAEGSTNVTVCSQFFSAGMPFVRYLCTPQSVFFH